MAVVLLVQQNNLENLKRPTAMIGRRQIRLLSRDSTLDKQTHTHKESLSPFSFFWSREARAEMSQDKRPKRTDITAYYYTEGAHNKLRNQENERNKVRWPLESAAQCNRIEPKLWTCHKMFRCLPAQWDQWKTSHWFIAKQCWAEVLQFCTAQDASSAD